MNYFQNFWNLTFDSKTKSDMPYLELKRMEMVNFIAIMCIIPTIVFAFFNINEGRFLLAFINVCNTMCGVAVLILQYQRKFHSGKAVLLISNFIFYLAGAILYKNGGEYFLLSILICSMLLYDQKIIHLIFGILVAISIGATILLRDEFSLGANVPKIRTVYNMMTALGFIVFAVNYFLLIIYRNSKEIEKQNEELKVINADKEKVFSIIAHDVKAPFANMESLVYGLRERVLNNQDSIQFINEIYQDIQNQNQVLDDVLQWGGSSMQGISNKTSNINIFYLLEDVINQLQNQISKKEINLNLNISKEYLVLGNREQLLIVFRNVITNAIKFSYSSSQIDIYLTFLNANLTVHIKDYGIGIKDNDQLHLFKVRTGNSVGTNNEPGTGFGLLLCKDLIERNNGSISIQSKLNEGSIFSISLPAEQTTEYLI
ncbi:sensor histidine kinase [Sphingobacterium sp. HJSM2_6]|uniref:sensor histidine kinase n=1 Tax=Sphingobacterium sp. HJSM2_6 TaxID=3366264 RepID=UPI003BD9E12A